MLHACQVQWSLRVIDSDNSIALSTIRISYRMKDTHSYV